MNGNELHEDDDDNDVNEEQNGQDTELAVRISKLPLVVPSQGTKRSPRSPFSGSTPLLPSFSAEDTAPSHQALLRRPTADTADLRRARSRTLTASTPSLHSNPALSSLIPLSPLPPPASGNLPRLFESIHIAITLFMLANMHVVLAC